jgi:hypothetical protein
MYYLKFLFVFLLLLKLILILFHISAYCFTCKLGILHFWHLYLSFFFKLTLNFLTIVYFHIAKSWLNNIVIQRSCQYHTNCISNQPKNQILKSLKITIWKSNKSLWDRQRKIYLIPGHHCKFPPNIDKNSNKTIFCSIISDKWKWSSTIQNQKYQYKYTNCLTENYTDNQQNREIILVHIQIIFN